MATHTGGVFARHSERPARHLDSAGRSVRPADRLVDASPPDYSRASARSAGRERRPRPGRPPAGNRLSCQLLPRARRGPERRPHPRRPDHGRRRGRDVPGDAWEGRDASRGRVQPLLPSEGRRPSPGGGAAAHSADGDAPDGAEAGRRGIAGPRGRGASAARAGGSDAAVRAADGRDGALSERTEGADGRPGGPAQRGRIPGRDRHSACTAVPGAGGERSHRRADEAAQPPCPGSALPAGDASGTALSQEHRVLDDRPRSFQAGQRLVRPPERRRGPGRAGFDTHLRGA